MTTIYVTHDQTEAMAMSDRIMVMEAGVVKQIGTPQEIYHKPNNRFVATLIGETNMLVMKVKSIDAKIMTVESEQGLVLRGLTSNFEKHTTAIVGETIYVSIRPEGFQTGSGDNTIKGIIEFVEFTGLSVNYIVNIDGILLKAMIINAGSTVKQVGEEIELHIPPRNLYFLGE